MKILIDFVLLPIVLAVLPYQPQLSGLCCVLALSSFILWGYFRQTSFTTSNISNKTLMDACIDGDVTTVCKCVDAGIDPERRDFWIGRSPFQQACYYGNYGVVRLLVQHFSVDIEDKDRDGNTPLILCCYEGNIDCAIYLLEFAWADITAKNNRGHTARDVATLCGNTNLVQCFDKFKSNYISSEECLQEMKANYQ